jgi:cation diffusion facilitator CzcD-associated flavoprotein CzcO
VNTTNTPAIVIIGTGFGGIAQGVKLVKAGIRSFTIIEKSPEAGGTWYENTYPGAEVDVGSHLYSYSFKAYDWSRSHARQPELNRYLNEVIDEYGLRSHIRFATSVVRAVWNESDHTYAVELGDGSVLTANVVVSAVGLLNTPQFPTWPGLDDFEGPKFHTARWEHHHDLTGKTVAVVGVGSTAAQMVPALADQVGRILVFQREPGWVIPKADRDFTDDERVQFASPAGHKKERRRLLTQIEKGQIRGAVNTLREQQCRDYIAHVFKDHPDLQAAVTPSYPYPGKRPVLCGDFYPSLLRDDVELVPHAVASVTKHGVVDVTGVEHPVDVLVMATGFQPANFLSSLEVVGRDGRTLHEQWAGEPAAFLGMTVPNFPNFYMLYGPNTNGGEIVSHLERQSEFVVRNVRRMMRDGVTAIEVRRSFYERYNQWLQRMMVNTAWTASNNYYKTASGRIVTQWPYGSIPYGVLTKTLGRMSETTRRRSSRL